MLATVEQFTPETGREAGVKSGEVRRQKSQELENLRLILATKPFEPTPIAPPKEPLAIAVEREVKEQLELTEEQIAHTRAELNKMNDETYGYCEKCKRHGADGKERAALLRELRGLMEHRLRLRGIGEPARMKPVQESTQRLKSAVVPLDCGPGPTTGSVPAQPAECSIPQSTQEPKAQ